MRVCKMHITTLPLANHAIVVGWVVGQGSLPGVRGGSSLILWILPILQSQPLQLLRHGLGRWKSARTQRLGRRV